MNIICTMVGVRGGNETEISVIRIDKIMINLFGRRHQFSVLITLDQGCGKQSPALNKVLLLKIGSGKRIKCET